MQTSMKTIIKEIMETMELRMILSMARQQEKMLMLREEDRENVKRSSKSLRSGSSLRRLVLSTSTLSQHLNSRSRFAITSLL